jgi:hypothetical protein
VTHVGWVDVLALALGIAVCVVLAFLVSPLAVQGDPDMVWEGRVAVGFTALVYVGPLWLGQSASTLFAALSDGGIWLGWLWGWLVVAPLLGASPPAAALARRSLRTFRGGSPGPDLHRSGAAVQQASNFAWADTTAEPGWELRRTPPLPLKWPPAPGGSAVWFCYAERSATPETIEVAGPWARMTLTGSEGAAVVERLSDAVESLGSQGIQPSGRPMKLAGLHSAIRRGDPDGLLVRTLQTWRVNNALIAAHSTVAQHLPPAV